ncbi:MAG: sodium:alanine symporter family protein [Oscillospiraceae bacterium]|nr:sodium:alanine symporter family protein [Oscillospiraceae bacterium]
MQLIVNINNAINGFVWGLPMLVLLMGAGLFLSLRTSFVQFRKFGHAMKNTIGKIFQKTEAKAGSVTPFQAMTTALAATVGTGNIAGITWAVTLGGAGAIFWMWIAALLGMCTKYAEIVLAIKYRERNDEGDWVGGPMYYIRNGLGKNWKWLSALFALFGALCAFGIGNAVQVGNITDSLNSAIQTFAPAAASSEATVSLIIGLVVAVIVAITSLGGIQRIGSVTEKMVPFMSLLYIVGALAIVFTNLDKLGYVFGLIFEGAFNPSAVVGGVGGIAIKECITWGVKRGVFSNEAGLGSAPIAYAAADVDHPVKQGLFGIFEVFVDTIVICTLTGLTLLLSGIDLNYGVKGSIALNMQAFATVMGDKFAAVVIGVGIALFALSTILSWALYGGRCIEYLMGNKARKIYLWIFVAICVVGATMDLGLAWDIADTLNGLMAIPNLIALFGLSGVVVSLTKDYFSKNK